MKSRISYYLLSLAALAAPIVATPALAELYQSSSGQTTARFEALQGNKSYFRYTAELGSTRITGSSYSARNGSTGSGSFDELHSDNTNCNGQLYLRHTTPETIDATWVIQGGVGCTAVGESITVELHTVLSGPNTRILHDPQSRPNERLNLRAAPAGRNTPAGKVIGYGLSGDIIEIIGKGYYGGWVRVRFRESGATGFMHSSLIR